MSVVINYRLPDPYVEVDGVRKPLSAYPKLEVIRTTIPEPLVGLREVNLLTGWLTLHAPAEKHPWLMNPDCRPQFPGEWEETATNLRIAGIALTDEGKPTEICVTGIDMRLAKRAPVARPVPQPHSAAAVKVPEAVKPPAPLGSSVVRTAPMSARPGPAKPVPPAAPIEAPVVATPAAVDPPPAVESPEEENTDWLDEIGKLSG